MWKKQDFFASRILREFNSILFSDDCPDPTCTGHGFCVEGSCVCRQGWRGPTCAIVDKEARQCLPDCSGHGDFDLETQKCVCRGQWTGNDCSKGKLLPLSRIDMAYVMASFGLFWPQMKQTLSEKMVVVFCLETFFSPLCSNFFSRSQHNIDTLVRQTQLTSSSLPTKLANLHHFKKSTEFSFFLDLSNQVLLVCLLLLIKKKYLFIYRTVQFGLRASWILRIRSMCLWGWLARWCLLSQNLWPKMLCSWHVLQWDVLVY